MRVRTPISILLVLVVLLLLPTVSAATITLTPAAIYETTIVWEELDIDNYQGNAIITDVDINSPDLQITDSKSYLGWTKTQDAVSINWADGSIEANVKSAVFEFQVSAPNVSEDTTEIVTVSINSAATIFNITILNDATPPEVTDITPDNYARANNANQAISATVIDAETGVSSVTYSWNDCIGGNDTEVTLIDSDGKYNAVADFGSFDEGSKACYTLKATNNAGETATVTGELQFDGTAPSVSIIFPTTFATETTEFKFDAADNIAAELSCVLELGGTELGIVNASNGTTTSVTYNLSSFDQGSTTWSVECFDGVGLSAEHEQAIVLDTEPPIIILDSEPYILRTQQSTFIATIVDVIGLANVSATFEGESVNVTQNGDKFSGTISADALGETVLELIATDDAGHSITQTETITVVPNHQLTLGLSPSATEPGKTVTASGTLTTDGNVTSTTVTVKTPSGDIAVDLVDGAYSASFTAPDAGTYIITVEYTEAGYTYKAEVTLTVQSTQQAQESTSSGYDNSWSGGSSYVKPGEEPPADSDGGSNAVIPDEPVEEPAEPANYEPLPPEEPRDALEPQATGIFTLLGNNIKWISLLLALGLLGGIGAYAYSRPPKKEGPVNWNGYFNK